MTNREKFITLVKYDVKALQAMSDENFIEWMTHGGFHWGGVFLHFALTNNYNGRVEIGEKDRLISWLNKKATFRANEALDFATLVNELWDAD